MSFIGKREIPSPAHDSKTFSVGQRVIARRTMRPLFRYGEVGVILDITVHGDDVRAATLTIVFDSGSVVRQLVGVLAGALSLTSYIDPRLVEYCYRGAESASTDFKNGIFRF